MTSVAVFGLSGNPSQNGHVGIVQALVTCGLVDGVVVVPCGGRPEPHKQGFVGPGHRLAMAHLAFDHLGTSETWVDVDEEDVYQPFFTPHVDLLERQRVQRSAHIIAAIGTDLLIAKEELAGRSELETWAHADRLIANWDILVVRREGLPSGAVLRMPKKATILEGPPIQAVSSTDIRGMVARGEPIDHLVPPLVAQYIRDHGLYLGQNV